MKKMLFVYATKTYTTREYVEYIVEKLKNAQVSIDVKTMEEAEDLNSYDIVVIGAPINGMMWLPEATNFVKNNKEILKEKTVFYFFVSYVYHNGRKMWHNAIDKGMKKLSNEVQPVFIGKFGGKIESKFPRLFAWMLGVKKDTPLNVMDFKQTDEFVYNIKEKIKEKE